MSAFSQMAKIWEAGTCFWAVAKVSNGVAIAKWALGKLISKTWYPDGSRQSISLFSEARTAVKRLRCITAGSWQPHEPPTWVTVPQSKALVRAAEAVACSFAGRAHPSSPFARSTNDVVGNEVSGRSRSLPASSFGLGSSQRSGIAPCGSATLPSEP